MKVLTAFAVFLALGATAQAKPAPIEPQQAASAADDAAMFAGAAGALRESDYFRAPQPPLAAGRIFPCRLQLRVFEKTRLAQSCR
jgi:hypothetical protein